MQRVVREGGSSEVVHLRGKTLPGDGYHLDSPTYMYLLTAYSESLVWRAAEPVCRMLSHDFALHGGAVTYKTVNPAIG